MPDIEFTQYLRPNGRRALRVIDRPQNVYDAAQAILKAGLTFGCEELMTGHVSLTIEDTDRDAAIKVVMNGPAVPAAVDALILGFDLDAYLAKRAEDDD